MFENEIYCFMARYPLVYLPNVHNYMATKTVSLYFRLQGKQRVLCTFILYSVVVTRHVSSGIHSSVATPIWVCP